MEEARTEKKLPWFHRDRREEKVMPHARAHLNYPLDAFKDNIIVRRRITGAIV